MAGSLDLDPTPENVARARRWCQERAIELGLSTVADEVGLLVSELVSNVVLHARTPCSVTVERRGAGLRVEVADGSPRPPSHRTDRDELAQSGRGMQLVDRVASAHGTVDRGAAGKTVWFEMQPPERTDR